MPGMYEWKRLLSRMVLLFEKAVIYKVESGKRQVAKIEAQPLCWPGRPRKRRGNGHIHIMYD